MNKVIMDQLEMLKTLEFQVDGKPSKDFPESFSEIVFLKNGKQLTNQLENTFKFENYIVKPFQGFDFHDKFNKGIAPPEIVMSGYIDRETEKMYYLKLHSLDKIWEGWCPKKSVTIIE